MSLFSLYLAYFLPIFFLRIKIFYKRDIIFSADEQCFFNKELTVFFVHENMKKTASKVKVAHNRPNFYSVFPTDPKTIKMAPCATSTVPNSSYHF